MLTDEAERGSRDGVTVCWPSGYLTLSTLSVFPRSRCGCAHRCGCIWRWEWPCWVLCHRSNCNRSPSSATFKTSTTTSAKPARCTRTRSGLIARVSSRPRCRWSRWATRTPTTECPDSAWELTPWLTWPERRSAPCWDLRSPNLASK